MEGLQEITECCFSNPSIENGNESMGSYLVRIAVKLKNEVLSKEMVFHINVRKDEYGWFPHMPTLARIKDQIKGEGFDPDTFNLEMFKCRILSPFDGKKHGFQGPKI